MWEIIKSIYKKLKTEPVYYVRETIPKTLGSKIRKE